MTKSKRTLFDDSSLDSKLSTMMAEIVYIRSSFGEMKNDIKELRSEFLKLELGRLTGVETEVAKMKVTHGIEARQAARFTSMWISVLVGVSIGLANLLLQMLLRPR